MTEKDVLELVDAWAATELAGDADQCLELLAEEFRGIGPVGFVLNREQWTARHRDGNLVNHEFAVTDAEVTGYGDTAIVRAVQQQKTTVRGHESNGSFRVGLV